MSYSQQLMSPTSSLAKSASEPQSEGMAEGKKLRFLETLVKNKEKEENDLLSLQSLPCGMGHSRQQSQKTAAIIANFIKKKKKNSSIDSMQQQATLSAKKVKSGEVTRNSTIRTQ